MHRTLLLQGPIGPFFRGLGRELVARGDFVRHVVFNGGDAWFADVGITIPYHGDAAGWPAFLAKIIAEHGFDRVFLFGDCRPLHQVAIAECARLGVAVYVVEEGYLRPHYLTVERDGVNDFSRLPRDPAWYLRQPDPDPGPPRWNYRHVFTRRIIVSMVYYLAFNASRSLFPRYCHHRPTSLLSEGYAWILGGWRYLQARRQDRGVLANLSGKPFFLVPLQVHGDFQITKHSRFASVAGFIREVMTSFACHAPRDQHLVIKHHPMDRGYRHYRTLINRLALRLGISERVAYVHDVPLPALLAMTRGVVVINSTVGISALLHQVPVKLLGRAMYALPGLVAQSSLDVFWRHPGRVDRQIWQSFYRVLHARTQLNATSVHAQSTWDLLDRIGDFPRPTGAAEAGGHRHPRSIGFWTLGLCGMAAIAVVLVLLFGQSNPAALPTG
jgi:capsule polysaccharide modification protein KpsS